MKYQTFFAYLLFSVASVMHAHVPCDEHGQTYLMRTVIQNENQRAQVRAAQNCYTWDRFLSGCIGLVSSKAGKDMDEASKFYYNNNQQQSARLLGNVRGLVQLHTPDQLQVQVTDHKGYSALNYCKTPEMYTLLRSHGVPFRYDAFLHVYGKKCVLSTAVAGLFGCVAYQFYTK